MQTIGRTEDGKRIVVIWDGEIKALHAAVCEAYRAAVVQVLGPEFLGDAVPVDLVETTAEPPPRQVSAKPGYKPARKSRAMADNKRSKICCVCEAAFLDDSRTNTRKTCSDACRAVQIKQRPCAGKPAAKRAPRPAATKPPAPPVNRMDALREANRRLQEKEQG